jgi:Calcineurin-like phosphoesterase
VIDLVLDKRFVLTQAEAVLAQLQKAPEEVAFAKDTGPGVQKVKTQLAAALVEESPAGTEAVDEREAYIPANAVLSVLQTVIEERLTKKHPKVLRPAPGFTDAGGPVATSVIAEDDFDPTDVHWVTAIAKALANRLRQRKHGFVWSDPPPAVEIADDALIVLVGDWGAGNAGARAVGTQIRTELQKAGDREVHLIHLGDVYYSGERWEARQRFLDPWPIQPGDPGRWHSWALNGNHDMYSGGHGYFEVILADDRFRLQRTPDGRGISCFRLYNDHWQFLALDSAWDAHLIMHQGRDGFISAKQAEWVRACLEPPQDRRTVLLTHHQLKSRHHHVSGNLGTRLGAVLADPGLDAWIWGHEHLCMKFAPLAQLSYALCAGHGALPHAVGGGNPEPGGWEYDVGHQDGDGHMWRLCGYVVLDLDGKQNTVRHVDQRGDTHHSPEIV